MPKINNPQNFAGETLISKEALGLASDDVLATSRTAGSEQVEDKVIKADYLPEIVFNNKGTVENKTMGPKIKFIGNCNVVQDPSTGELTIRIGDNLNSSNFTTTDGQTEGVDNAIVTAPKATAGTLSNGTSVNAIPSGNYIIRTTAAATGTAEANAQLIHFENKKNTSFEVAVEDNGVTKVYYFGPITGDGTYNAKLTNAEGETVPGVTMKVSNFGEEPKTAAGATGYCGSVTFTIAASAIANGADSSIKIVSVKHKNGADGEFIDDKLDTNTRYFYTDTTTKPTITSAGVTVTAGGSKTVSGVKYLTSATANYSVEFTDIATPVCVADNVSFEASFAADATNLDAKYNATSMTGSGTISTGQYPQASNTVKVTVKNINDSVEQTVTLADYSLLVDTNTAADTALIAYFDTEDNANYPRLNSDLTAFDNTKSIVATGDLMQKNGQLIYPSGNYTGYNTILGTDFTQPNYSTGLTTGKRTWYRKFFEAGDKNGATLTFAAAANIAATAFGNSLTVKVGVIADDGSVAWYDATKKATQADDGIATDVKQNKLIVDWGAYGAAKKGIIIELGMTSASHTINTLTVAFA